MTRKPEPIEWDETTITAAAVPEEAPVEEEAWTLPAKQQHTAKRIFDRLRERHGFGHRAGLG
jgi:hypothetical protein